MGVVFPCLLVMYPGLFRDVFSSPRYEYFKACIWAFMQVPGRKRVTDSANACFFMKNSQL
jgi:hypothetical protein